MQILKNLFKRFRYSAAFKNATFRKKNTQELRTNSLVEKRFVGAIDFLHSKEVKFHGRKSTLADLPWIILLGPENVGKTTLLSQAEQEYLLSKKFKSQKPEDILPTESHDWWVTKEAVFLDTTGDYINPRKKVSDMGEWQNFSMLIGHYLKPQLLKGIILVFSVDQLLEWDSKKLKSYINSSIHSINDLAKTAKQPVPFYVIINKCDRLNGFNSYFYDIPMTERNNAWGVNFEKETQQEPQKQLYYFANEFDRLTKQLNRQVLWRMHHEQDEIIRPNIRLFAEAFLELKRPLLQMVHKLTHHSKLKNVGELAGIYFTSAVRNAEETLEFGATTQAVALNRSPSTAPTVKKAYFVKALIKHITDRAGLQTDINAYESKRIPNLFAYVIAFCTVMGLALLLVNNYRQEVEKLQKAELSLARYQIAFSKHGNNMPIHVVLDSLSSLRAAIDTLEHAGKSRWHWFLPTQDNRLIQSSKKAYKNFLETRFLPVITANISQAMQNDMAKQDWKSVYNDLSVYLNLFSEPFTIDERTKAWLQSHLLTQEQQPLLEDMIYYLGDALKNNAKQNYDAALVEKAQTALKELPATQLSSIILQENLGQETFESLNLPLQSTSYTVPGVFTRKALERMDNEIIEDAVTQALTGNKVLGQQPEVGSTHVSSEQLKEALLEQYAKDYVEFWENLLKKVNPIIKADNFIQLSEEIAEMADELEVIWQAVYKNTGKEEFLEKNPILTEFNDWYANQLSLPERHGVVNALRHLSEFMQTVAKQAEPEKAAFILARGLGLGQVASDPMQALAASAKAAPASVQASITIITQEANQFIYNSAIRFITQVWETLIIPNYQQTMAVKYPFNAKGKQEVSLNEFVSFFGPNGVLANFNAYYAKPFIDESQTEWHWKTDLSHYHINFPKNILQVLQKAELLQRLLFAQNSSAPSIRFELIPQAITKDMKQFDFAINGQTFPINNQGQGQVVIVPWPGAQYNDITLRFTDINDQVHMINEQGLWAFLRILDNAQIENEGTENVNIVFTLNQEAVKYQMSRQALLFKQLIANFKLDPSS